MAFVARSRKNFFLLAATFPMLALPFASTVARAGSNAWIREIPSSSEDGRAHRQTDQRLDAWMPVVGVVIGEEPRAYAVSDLEDAGAAIHDFVAGTRLDIELDGAAPRITPASAPVREHRIARWDEWTSAHPDTSLWRPSAVAEPQATRSANQVRVTQSRHYTTAFGCALISARVTTAGAEPPELVVISGTIVNVDDKPVHHVVLRYELVDSTGAVVYRDEGFNRSAEALAAPRLMDAGAVVPIDSGETDTFRMIFLADDLPPFDRTRVTVSRVY